MLRNAFILYPEAIADKNWNRGTGSQADLGRDTDPILCNRLSEYFHLSQIRQDGFEESEDLGPAHDESACTAGHGRDRGALLQGNAKGSIERPRHS